MATWGQTNRFRKDHDRLSSDEKRAFKRAVKAFVEDLSKPKFRAGLRVKGVQGARGVFEMSWGDGGRATFSYGSETKAGHPHIIWRRCGGHEIFNSP